MSSLALTTASFAEYERVYQLLGLASFDILTRPIPIPEP